MNIIEEINAIIYDIEKEINSLSKDTKKKLKNNVYSLGYSYLNTVESRPEKYYAFVLEKPWFKDYKLTLKSSDNIKGNSEDYRIYRNYENLEIFDIESLVKIKYFLLSFAGE